MANTTAVVIDLTAESDDEGIALATLSSHHNIANDRRAPYADRTVEQKRVLDEAKRAGVIDLTGEEDDEATGLQPWRAPNNTTVENDSKRKHSFLQVQTFSPPARLLEQPISPEQRPVLQLESATSPFRSVKTDENDATRISKRSRSPPSPSRWPLLDRQISPQHRPVLQRGTVANPFEIIDPDEIFRPSEATLNPPSELENGVVLFADGSYLENGGVGGAGVAFKTGVRWSGRAVALGEIEGSFEAEMCAVHEAFKLLGDLLRPTDRYVQIYTDCQGAIVSINKVRAGLEGQIALAQDIVAEEDAVKGQGVEVRIGWVKGHKLSAGNQFADHLAGTASKQSKVDILMGGSKGPRRSVLPLREENLASMGDKAARMAEHKAKKSKGKGNPEVLREKQISKEHKKTERRQKKMSRRRKVSEMENVGELLGTL